MNPGAGRLAPLLVLLFQTPAAAPASEPGAGERLHAEHCSRCHDSGIYLRQDRLVRSYTQLRERVQQCQLANDLLWFDEEVDQVTGFLNRQYYHFPAPP